MPKLFMSLFLLLCLNLKTSAQYTPGVDFGVGTGIAVYQGDLSPYRFGSFNKAGLALQLFGQVTLSPKLMARANYSFAALKEQDNSYFFTYKQHRNFSFETSVNELSLQLIFSPLETDDFYDGRRLLPYVFAGAGIAKMNITRDWSGFDHNWRHWQKWVREGLVKDSAQVMPTTLFTLPVGVGLKFKLGENISLFTEANHRFTNEEYIDGFSEAANPKKKDAFTTITAGLIFRRD